MCVSVSSTPSMVWILEMTTSDKAFSSCTSMKLKMSGWPKQGCTCWTPAIVFKALTTSLVRSEEHTSELQSQSNLVCRLLLEKKNKHVRANGVILCIAGKGRGFPYHTSVKVQSRVGTSPDYRTGTPTMTMKYVEYHTPVAHLS